MISRLRGIFADFSADHVVVDVGGVGYLVYASTRTIAALGAVGQEVVVHTVMQVSQDDIRLIGFAAEEERDWFRLLTSVQGVGARVALAILSALSGEELHRAVASGDSAMVSRSQGVGPKLATRIVNELKEKLAEGVAADEPTPLSPKPHLVARDALVELGFTVAEAEEALATIDPEAPPEERVREALKKAA